MDHLPLPSGHLVRPPIVVPFLCDGRVSYDDLGFLTYPDRVGLKLEELVNHPQFNPNHVARVLQTWLWFGLLGEVLGIGTRFDVPQRVGSSRPFIGTAAPGFRVIRTAALLDCIRAASARNRLRRPDDCYIDRFYNCLRVAERAVDSLLQGRVSRLYLLRGSPFDYSPVLSRVVFSVQILVETLLTAAPLLFPESRNALLRQGIESSSYQLVDELLVEAGWCRQEIESLPRSKRLRYYLSFLRRADPVDHLLCTKLASVHIADGRLDIEPKHVAERCRCSPQSMRDGALVAIVVTGAIPLLTFSEMDGAARRLEYVQTWLNNDISFVAISHVRRAGLGNAAAHSLPFCQLARLQQIANRASLPAEKITGRYAHYSRLPMPFWLDTMCLPTEPQAHADAILSVRQIFEHAALIVVVDEGLLSHAVGSPEEALVRIRYSRWKSRLWTLQEGFIAASKLMFCFADDIVSLGSLLESYQGETSVPFPLLTGTRFVGFRVLPHLARALDMLDDDIKFFLERVDVAAYPEMKRNLRQMLRLGYLASDDYRFFRDGREDEMIAKLLGVLGEFYLGPDGSLLGLTTRSGEHILRGLHHICEIA
ncbi:hypothetical protein J3F83DRAFT_704999 [Trichoderma novae-zelandiae]